jgi:hypothetical protein
MWAPWAFDVYALSCVKNVNTFIVKEAWAIKKLLKNSLNIQNNLKQTRKPHELLMCTLWVV